MMGENDLFGVYLNSELVTSMLALVLTYGVHRLLVLLGLHRRVWHRPLFETALFMIIWGAILTVYTSSVS